MSLTILGDPWREDRVGVPSGVLIPEVKSIFLIEVFESLKGELAVVTEKRR